MTEQVLWVWDKAIFGAVDLRVAHEDNTLSIIVLIYYLSFSLCFGAKAIIGKTAAQIKAMAPNNSSSYCILF